VKWVGSRTARINCQLPVSHPFPLSIPSLPERLPAGFAVVIFRRDKKYGPPEAIWHQVFEVIKVCKKHSKIFGS